MRGRQVNEAHDPLKAIAMVVQSVDEAIALIGVDE